MTDDNKIPKEDREKIDSLKSIIDEAEKSLYSARAMLARLETNNTKPQTQKRTYGASPDGKIVEGVFDGQLMIGNDGKQYPVPANYASKSRLVEGDMLKLTITDDGNFIYKQIGPVDRKRLIGIVEEDEGGNYIVSADGNKYKVLLASVTYYKAQPGDEVTIVLPRIGEPIWCSIENVTKKAYEIEELKQRKKETEENIDDEDIPSEPFMKEEEKQKELKLEEDEIDLSLDLDDDEKEQEKPKKTVKKQEKPAKKADKENKTEKKEDSQKVSEEWTPKLSQIEKEAKEIEESTKEMQKKINKTGMVEKDFPDTPEEILNKDDKSNAKG